MNKSQLIDAVTERADLSKADVAAAIGHALAVIQEVVAKGDEVQITGFGTWKRAQVKGGTVRNLATGEPVTYGDTWKVSFSAGAGFKAAVKAGPKQVSAAA
ncbi:DNA-binding protein HU [Nonomuraea phyllanthi]|uniref:DNA-binding protein HU n=1 Tax=Nonomuraea phyllanthi TaxID=2219224 RepID=A0A5C4V5M8_9ACTN|nr:HU family DNA-binding protein [Nonomuraea phyllanthi]KAB8186841.1 DNA-binding protein HU [Nonomuraea phyllanthi]